MSESGPNKYITQADERVMVDLGDYRNLHRRVEALEDEVKRFVCLVNRIPPELLAPHVLSASLEDAKRLEAEWSRKLGLIGTGYATGDNSCVTRMDAGLCTDHGVPQLPLPYDDLPPVAPGRATHYDPKDSRHPGWMIGFSDWTEEHGWQPRLVDRPTALCCAHCGLAPASGFVSFDRTRFVCEPCYQAGKR